MVKSETSTILFRFEELDLKMNGEQAERTTSHTTGQKDGVVARASK